MKLLPPQTRALYRALELLAEAPIEQRTMTNLITQVQDAPVRDGLAPTRSPDRWAASSTPIVMCCSKAISSPSNSKP